MTTQKHLYLPIAVFALLAVLVAVAVGQTEHEGAACIQDTTDCDDMLPGRGNDGCIVRTCEGGANDFSYCQISSSGGSCQTEESSVNNLPKCECHLGRIS